MTDLFGDENKPLPFDIPNDDRFICKWNDEWAGYEIGVPNGDLFYSPEFFSKKLSDRSAEYFQEVDSEEVGHFDFRQSISEIPFRNIKWKQDAIKMYGKEIPLPRLTSWYGDPGKSYKYSGIKSEPNEWNAGLLHIKERIERCANVKFNSVLLNWYRDGNDYLNWHADDERELGENPIIASANFGATRDFVIRRNDETECKLKIPLMHGTLLIMRGQLQHFWSHSVPKRTTAKGSRFNLTFRRIGI